MYNEYREPVKYLKRESGEEIVAKFYQMTLEDMRNVFNIVSVVHNGDHIIVRARETK